jgi:hypothetical protein
VFGQSVNGDGVHGESSGHNGVMGISHSAFNNGVYGSNDGGGQGVKAVSTGSGYALLAQNDGSGAAGTFEILTGSNSSTVLQAITSGSGTAVSGGSNGGTGIYGTSTGGHAAMFENTNAANANTVVYALSNSNGIVFGGTSTGSGRPAYFSISNASNANDALTATTNGTGDCFVTNHSGASGNLAVFRSAGANKARIDKTGKGFFNGGTQNSGADVAELFDVEADRSAYEPGDVLAVSRVSDRAVTKSSEPYSTLVVGVYATRPGVVLTEGAMDDDVSALVPLGVIGVIPTKVTAANGPIRRGDPLVSSSIPGCAMRGTDRARMLNAVIGKALEDFSGPGTGRIRVLVNVK